MTKQIIPAARRYFEPESISWVADRIRKLLASEEYLSLGRYCEVFEEEVRRYIGVKYCAVCGSGTDALELILRAAGTAGGRVIIPVTENPAAALAVIRSGAFPVFVDSLHDFSPDPGLVERILSREGDVRAVLGFHGGGFISESVEELRRLCNENNVAFLEDAAHAFGSMLRGVKAGAIGLAAAFSLYATKVLTAGEGGLVTTSNQKLEGKVRTLRNYGLENNELTEIGLSSRMAEAQAIIGIAQLRTIENNIRRREEIAKLYEEKLETITGVESIPKPPSLRPNYYKFPVIILKKNTSVEKIRDYFRKNGINLPGRVFEKPLNRHRVLSRFSEGVYSVAEHLSRTHITLPIYPQLSYGDVELVVKTLKDALSD